MKISAIIPTLNEAPRIEHSVQRAWDAGIDELIVVDGGSRDSTADIVRSLDCQFVAARRGRACQLNAGAAIATGDVLLFLHADNWLVPSGADQIRAAFAQDRGHGAFFQRIDSPGRVFRWLESGNAARIRLCGLPYGDQGIFVAREVFEEQGGFPDFPLMEDVALSRSLRRKTWPKLLPGPLHVDPRRWQKHGIVRQTFRNWMLLAAYFVGVSPNRLAKFYPSA